MGPPILPFVVLAALLTAVQPELLQGPPRSYHPGFFDESVLHDRVNETEIGEETVLYAHENVFRRPDNGPTTWFHLVRKDFPTDCDASFYVCYFTPNKASPVSKRCGANFTEVNVKEHNKTWSFHGCNFSHRFQAGYETFNLSIRIFSYDRNHEDPPKPKVMLTDSLHSRFRQKLWTCPYMDLVPYPYKTRFVQTIIKFIPDPTCDIYRIVFNSTQPKYESGILVKRLTTTTEPPTTTTTTSPPPVPLEPLSIEVFILVFCFCGIFNIISIVICTISGIFRKRRLKKQEALFYSVLRMHYQEQRQLNAASVLKNGKAAPMLTQEAFMANVQKVLDEDRGKEEISAIGDEAATPETFVRFMSLEPLYRHSKGREAPENSTVTTCGDSLAARTASKKKVKDTTKSKTRTAEMVQPPSSDNEWLQLSDKAATPDILSNEKDLKDIQEYNALSQSTWEERIGELDSLTKLIKADLKTHGVTADNSTATTPSTEATSWLQAATSLHKFIAESTSTLSPSVFKLRYKEQLVFLEEQKLSELYRSALLSVEKQHRIAFLQMVFHKFSLLQKPNPKQADKTVKNCHPYPLLDRLSHQFPEYFAIYVKSSEK